MSFFPKNEKERLEDLKSLDILDSKTEKEFDTVLKLAAAICEVPIALISLLDEDRQWFKAKIGLDATQTPRDISFCQYTILGDEIYEVSNATKNTTFKNNPLVTGNPHIKFYAGAPLKDEHGLNIGTLCVISKEEKKLSKSQKEALELLALETVSIIKLRKLHKELEVSRLENESILHVLQEGVVYQDLHGSIVKLNKKAEEILGLSYDQMIGKKSVDPTWRSIHEDGSDFPGNTHPAMETLRTKESLNNVIMGVHKPNNELTWISINSVPIFSKINKTEIKGVICTFKDITKNKKINDDFFKIKEHDFISKIVDKTKDIVVITNKEGCIIWVNIAFEKLTEYTLNEVKGKKPGEILQGKKTEHESILKIREAISKKEIVETSITNYTKSGKEYILNISISPIFKEHTKDEVEYYIAIERDVTDLLRIQEEKEQQFKKLIESQKIAKIGNWDFNVKTNEVQWSDELYNIFDIDKEKIKSKDLFNEYLNKIHPNDLELLNNKVKKAIQQGLSYTIEHRIITKEGVKYVSGTSQAFKDQNGDVISLMGTLQDISERKKRDNKIKISSERWKFAIENTGDGIWDYDLVNNRVYQSAQLLKNLGYTKDEFADNHQEFLNLIHPDDKEKADKAFFNHLKGKTKHFTLEYRVKNKAGHYNWILDRAKVIERDENKNPLRMIGVHQDQTKRKKNELLRKLISELSEKALSDNNNKDFHLSILNKLLEITNSEYGFIGEVFQDENNKNYLKTYAITNIAWDEGTKKFYDKNAPNGMEFRNQETLFGYTLKNNELVIANDPKNDQRKGGLPKGHPPLNNYIGIPVILDNILIGMIGLANKFGGYHQKDYEFILPFINTLSNVIHSVKIDRQREKSQNQILSIKNELESFFELTNDFMCIANIDGTFKKVNHEFERSLGYKREELEGKPFVNLIHEEDLDATYHEIEKLKKGIKTVNFLNRYKHRNGHYIYLDWKASTDTKTGNIYATTRDVTKERQINAELIAEKQKAELANKAKSEFLANMSHEIRTPLNGIIGFSDLLNKSNLDDNQLMYSETITKSGKSLLKIINDILDFSKIEAGKTQLDIQKTDIHKLVYEAIDSVTFQAQTKRLDLLIKIDSNLPDHIYIDETHLKQILINLIGNAIKFTTSGEITINIGVIEKIDNFHSKFIFSIQDTGIGIAEDKLDLIFETFTQADSTTTKQYGGTGLGLNISNSLVQLMGGEKLNVRSKLNKGSEFYFELELKHEPLTPKKPYFSEKKHILLANKSKNESVIIKNILAEENIEVVFSNSCQETKKIFIENPNFDLVVVDSQLYNKENNRDLKKLVEHETFNISKTNIGIITRSIHKDTYYDDCKQYGVNFKAAKPVKAKFFKETIYKMLNQNKRDDVESVVTSINKLKMLIAEDNSINRLLIKTVIENFNLDVDLMLVKDGEEAVRSFIKFQPNIIFMDIMMPVMNGYDATSRIKKINKNNQLKIYALTAGDREDKFIQEEMDGYIEKPLDAGVIKKIILKYKQ